MTAAVTGAVTRKSYSRASFASGSSALAFILPSVSQLEADSYHCL